MEHVEQLGPYRCVWTEDCFPLGGDSLALGEFATVRKRWRVCDLGCGAGTLLLLLLAREPTLSVLGVELHPGAAAQARKNLADNALPGEISTGDLAMVENLPPAGSCDLAVSNPPYFPAGSGGDGGTARMEHGCTLDELCGAAARILKNGGRFALVHRPERLCDLMCNLRAHGLEPKRMRLLRHSPDHTPSAVLLEAVKQGRPGLDIEP